MGSLDGRRALVTGASRGIGRAIAAAYAREGADVAAGARTISDLESLAEECGEQPGDVVPVELDVRDPDSVDRAVGAAVDEFGGLDTLVNNAGVITRGALVDTAPEDEERVLDVNLRGVTRVTRACTPHLREAGEGGEPRAAIVNVSSVTARVATRNLPVYSASKGAVSALTRQQSAELGPEVRVSYPRLKSWACQWTPLRPSIRRRRCNRHSGSASLTVAHTDRVRLHPKTSAPSGDV